MNVIIANEAKNTLANLDVDVIKSLNGVYTADELVDMFKNFFFARMILDITAIRDYDDISNIQKISMNLDASKIILVLPATQEMSSSTFLSKIISMGIYNFTTNLEGIKYLLEHPNSYKDVAHIQQLSDVSSTINDSVMNGTQIIGIKNVTDHAGATTFIYILKKELERIYGMSVYAIEINRHDFAYFNDKNMISTTSMELSNTLLKLKDATVILIDLNDSTDTSSCGDVLYLIEPSMIKLNKLIRRNRNIFSTLKGKKIVLNKSMLTNNDVSDFEYEIRTKVFYNMPPLNERGKNDIVNDLLAKIGLLKDNKPKEEEGRIFGLFRR